MVLNRKELRREFLVTFMMQRVHVLTVLLSTEAVQRWVGGGGDSIKYMGEVRHVIMKELYDRRWEDWGSERQCRRCGPRIHVTEN